jgi:MoxR-like ATPase
MRLLDAHPGEAIQLDASSTVPEMVHVLDSREIAAVNAAIAAKRPLLVRGEPGIGKSQLARAAAKALDRAFVPFVVDARTESRDLLWHYDAVARLADAQLLGALAQPQLEFGDGSGGSALERIAIGRYLHPRALWWAFDWPDALCQAGLVGETPPLQLDGGDPANGCLVLIDEIDKAESDVPNGLLEALGAGCFTPAGKAKAVVATGTPPLVIITTNEERTLPDAFVRRCLVLHLALPTDREELKRHLVARATAHFPGADATLLKEAADLLIRDRETAQREHWLPLPGQAEYLDLVRAVLALAETRSGSAVDPGELLGQVASYVLEKHPDAFRRSREHRI